MLLLGLRQRALVSAQQQRIALGFKLQTRGFYNNNYNRNYRRFGGGYGAEPAWKRRPFWYAVGVTGVSTTVYYQTHLEESPTGRRRFIAVSPEYERMAGKSAYAQIMSEYRRQIVPQNTQIDRYVRRVAMRIIQASKLEGDWEVHVIDSPEKNAFVLPGGKIFVFSGLLPLAANEDGLATVLAHEIAHQYARHSAEKLSAARVLSLLYTLVAIFVDPNAAQAGRAVTTLLLDLPNSRECEQEADQIGLQLMAAACYDPAQAIQLWQRMQNSERMAPPQLLNTHPSTQSRIENIRGWIPSAQMKREAANCPNPELTNSFFGQLGF
ncbi:metalloendopeptidase [Coemansia guatemalensis]|uniref:Metalloendopeptidase n=1 Tax=Coemansia guatemalensis TaxID=2761395 RepID=A0A9W8LSL5_9FUNG|nr:metalloendopeptidase [Coemansia guatemalensis]